VTGRSASHEAIGPIPRRAASGQRRVPGRWQPIPNAVHLLRGETALADEENRQRGLAYLGLTCERVLPVAPLAFYERR
jgi:hypothetical protein